MATVVQAGGLTSAPIPRLRVGGRGERVPFNLGFGAMTAVLLLVAFLVLFPLGMLLYGSFWTARPGFPGAFTLDNYLKAYTSLETYQVLFTTVLLIGTKTLLAVSFATALAWIVTRTDTPFSGLLE